MKVVGSAVFACSVAIGSAAAIEAQFDPPTIVVDSATRRLGVSGNADMEDFEIDEESLLEGPWVQDANKSVVGSQASLARAEGHHHTTISTFAIRGEGRVEVLAISDPAGSAGSNADSIVLVEFQLPVDAAFSLVGEVSTAGSDVESFGTAIATMSFSGTDADTGEPFNLPAASQHPGAASGPDPFAYVGTIKAGTTAIIQVDIIAAVGTFGQGAETAWATFEFDLDLGDRDGDGLLDVWEREGLDIDGMPPIDFPLHVMGAKEDRKDLFVEVDVMAGSAFDTGPVDTWQPIQDVVDAFAGAPADLVGNPVGGHISVVRLHVVDGEHAPSHQALSGSCGPTECIPTQFEAIKEDHFGLPHERVRDDWDELERARSFIYRYCLWADTLEMDGVASPGGAEIPGDDFVIAAGTTASMFPTVVADALAGVFMHELGHNLGLRHGGQDAHQFKPNYLSVMSYIYQAPLDVPTPEGTNVKEVWFLDYSRKAAATLNENALVETEPLDGPAGREIIFNSAPEEAAMRELNIAFANDQSTNWNNNGNSAEPLPYQLDISRIDQRDSPSYETALVSYTDWDRLWYHLWGFDHFVDRDSGTGDGASEPTEANIDPDTLASILSADWVDQTALSPEIFWNGFENGDLSAWTEANP